MSTPWKHIKHKAEIDKPCRFEIWKQYTNTEDWPWRRKGDRKHGLKFLHNGSSGWHSWDDILPLVGRHAVVVRTFYDPHQRCRVVQVFIGHRSFFREYFRK